MSDNPTYAAVPIDEALMVGTSVIFGLMLVAIFVGWLWVDEDARAVIGTLLVAALVLIPVAYGVGTVVLHVIG
jgi:hypothetical protein